MKLQFHQKTLPQHFLANRQKYCAQYDKTFANTNNPIQTILYASKRAANPARQTGSLIDNTNITISIPLSTTSFFF